MPKKNQETQQTGTQTEAAINFDDRHDMIVEAAYFIAERRGFDGECEAHWLEAKREIDQVGNPE